VEAPIQLEENHMQEKLIALTIVGLLAVPAFAQSSVILYGSLDYGFTNLGHHVTDGIKSRSGIDSSISKSNRLGFKGTEDLGNGLKAVFVLENGLNGDIQGSSGIWSSSARQSYAGLAGGFGTIAFGRQYAPQHTFIGAVDPFGNSGLGAAGNAMIQHRRLNNLAAYISPNWSGFNFIAAYTLAGTAQEAAENDGDVRVWAFAPSFTMDNLFVAANYQSAKIHNVSIADQKVMNAWDLFASYDFGFVKMGTSFGKRTTKTTMPNPKFTQWMLGATFKLTPNDKILTSYARGQENDTGAGKPRISQWAVGYEHALSKRTTLYAQFATQSWNDAARAGFKSFMGDDGVGGVGFTQLNGGSADDYRRGITAGFRHDF